MKIREGRRNAALNASVNGKESSHNGKAGTAKQVQWKYSKSIEDPKHIQLDGKYDLYIGGKHVRTKKYFNTIDPSNEKILAEVAYASGEDVNRAVTAAKTAYEKHWSKTPPKERAKYIFRIARIMQEKAREFAVIETMNGGKPIRESKSVDVPLSIAHFFYYAGWADKLDFAFPGQSI